MANNTNTKVNNFLKETKTLIKITKAGKNRKYFAADTEKRAVYRVSLDKDGKKESYLYGTSIVDTEQNKKPTKTEVLYAPVIERFDGSYNEFLGEFGYEDTKVSKKTYNAVIKNTQKYDNIFNKKEQEKLDKIYQDY